MLIVETPVAALTVTAHLLKLEREGRVARTQDASGKDTWRLALPGPKDGNA